MQAADQGRRRQGHQMRVVTMRDIAEATGLSQSTVSRVLSGAPSAVAIGERTRSRVLEIANELGYRPNPLARGLRGASTMLLGVIVREITDPFFAGAIDAISTAAASRGYNIVLGHAHGKADEAIALRAVLETRHCDALVLLGDMSDQPRLLDDLRDSHVPVVALWQGAALEGVASVNVDNAHGIDAALDHIVGLGHRRIGLIAGRQLGDIRQRRSAFVHHVDALGERWSHVVIEGVPNDPAGGAEAFETLMRGSDPPTAVVATTDTLAIGALHAAHELGLRVPEDVSVVGFDDIALALYTVPALTTVHMPVAEMATLAVGIAIDEAGMLEAAEPPAHVLQPTFVVRDSTVAPRSLPAARSGAR